MATKRQCRCTFVFLEKPDHLRRMWRFHVLPQCSVHWGLGRKRA